MKKQICLIVLLLTGRICDAQIPDWEWARSAAFYDTSGYGRLWSSTVDDLENVYLAGYFVDSLIAFGADTLFSTDPVKSTVFIAKYDSSGNVLWVRNSSGTANAEAFCITTNFSGNVYVTGQYSQGFISFGSDTLSSATENIFIVKYDSSGNELWARNAGGSFLWASSISVATDPFENVFITGQFFSSDIIFGSTILTNSGGNDVFIAKFDSSGNVMWAKSAIGAMADNSWSIACDHFGNAYITGGFVSPTITFGTYLLNNPSGNNSNVFIVKYDSSGNVLWAQGAGYNGPDGGSSIITDSSNHVYAIGFFTSPGITFGSFTVPWGSTSTSYIVKFDSSGNILWAKGFGGNGYEDNLILDSFDNIYIGGKMYGQMTFDAIALQVPSGLINPKFIVKYDPSGNALWAMALPSGGTNMGGKVYYKNENIYLGGNFIDNPFVLGSDTLIRTGSQDIFVAKLANASNVSIPEINNKQQIILFPNPFDYKLNIRVNTNQQEEIILYDIVSRKLLQQKFINSVTLNTEQLGKGLYLYEVRNKNGLCKKGKVVKD